MTMNYIMYKLLFHNINSMKHILGNKVLVHPFPESIQTNILLTQLAPPWNVECLLKLILRLVYLTVIQKIVAYHSQSLFLLDTILSNHEVSKHHVTPTMSTVCYLATYRQPDLRIIGRVLSYQYCRQVYHLSESKSICATLHHSSIQILEELFNKARTQRTRQTVGSIFILYNTQYLARS